VAILNRTEMTSNLSIKPRRRRQFCALTNIQQRFLTQPSWYRQAGNADNELQKLAGWSLGCCESSCEARNGTCKRCSIPLKQEGEKIT